MNLKELVKKTFWTPRDLAIATGMSVTAARKVTNQLRNELEGLGYINLNNSKVPSKFVIERLNIDVDWLEKVGALNDQEC